MRQKDAPIKTLEDRVRPLESVWPLPSDRDSLPFYRWTLAERLSRSRYDRLVSGLIGLVPLDRLVTDRAEHHSE